MKTRTRWIRRFLWLAGFGCLWVNVLDDPPLYTDPYVQDVSDSAATIACITSVPRPLVLVVRDAQAIQVAELRGAAQRRHAFRVTGLQPAAEYTYQLTGLDDDPSTGSFSTAPRAGDDAVPVRFAFCGDSGDQPWWVWLQRTPILHIPARWRWLPTKHAVTEVGAAMAAYEPEFALHLGDVIYPKGLHAHYSSGCFRPFAQLLRKAPMYAVVGNHDVMNAAGQQILANFHLPHNDVTGDERCFSFAWGAVRVIALDSNTWLSGDHYLPDHPTHRFLLAELQRCAEPWVVVAGHHPMRSASRQGNNGEMLSVLLPALEEWQVSIYLSGHDHCYQRFGPGERYPVPLVVSGGGGKRLYDITKDPRQRAGAESLEKAYHWCSAEVSGKQFRVAAWGLDGERLDEFHLALPEGADLEKLRVVNPGRARRIDALR